MQQQDDRSLCEAGFTVEHAHAVGFDEVVRSKRNGCDRLHSFYPQLEGCGLDCGRMAAALDYLPAAGRSSA